MPAHPSCDGCAGLLRLVPRDLLCGNGQRLTHIDHRCILDLGIGREDLAPQLAAAVDLRCDLPEGVAGHNGVGSILCRGRGLAGLRRLSRRRGGRYRDAALRGKDLVK